MDKYVSNILYTPAISARMNTSRSHIPKGHGQLLRVHILLRAYLVLGRHRTLLRVVRGPRGGPRGGHRAS